MFWKFHPSLYSCGFFYDSSTCDMIVIVRHSSQYFLHYLFISNELPTELILLKEQVILDTGDWKNI